MRSRRAQRRRPAKCRSVRFPQGGGQRRTIRTGAGRRQTASARKGIIPKRTAGPQPRQNAPPHAAFRTEAARAGSFCFGRLSHELRTEIYERSASGIYRKGAHPFRTAFSQGLGRPQRSRRLPPLGDGCRSGAIPAERCRNGSQRAATSYRSSGTIRRQANAAEPPRNRGAPRGGAGPPSKPYRLFRTAARSATEGPRPPSSRFSRIRAIR